VIRAAHFATCDGCGVSFSHRLTNGERLASFSDRDALLVALGASGWGLLAGDDTGPDAWSVVCASCRGVL
jgi:hypothetical protein